MPHQKLSLTHSQAGLYPVSSCLLALRREQKTALIKYLKNCSSREIDMRPFVSF